MIIRTVHGIDLKKFLKISLTIISLFLIQAKHSLSNENLIPSQCLNEQSNHNLIIEEFEKNLNFFKERNLNTVILYDLNFIHYCYKKINNELKYLKIYEDFIDNKLISKNTYKNLEYDDIFLKKDWRNLIMNYILMKSTNIRKDNNNKLDGPFPKTKTEIEIIENFFEIFNEDTEKNFKDIVKLSFFSYLENDINYSDLVLSIIDKNLKTAKKLNDIESYIILVRQKSKLITTNYKNLCKNFYEKEIKEIINISSIINVRQFYTDLKIIEINDQISKIFENLFYCDPLSRSFKYSIEYSKILEFLIDKKNTENTSKVLKDKHMQVVFWQLENSKKLGNIENFQSLLKIFENLQTKYDVSKNEKIKYEIFKINNLDEFKDIYKKEKKVIVLLSELENLNFKNYIERNPYLDPQSFKAEKLKLKLEIFRIYADILLQTGRKQQAVNILKDQIQYYEAFRNQNEYSVKITDDKLTDYKDTNQILPNLYHQIIILFSDLKDQKNYKLYADASRKLCDKLEVNNLNDNCYVVNLSILRGIKTFNQDLFSKNQIIKLIDKADLYMNWFLKSENINRYSKKAQARFKNDYVNSIQFALTTISPLSSREIIDFSYREKNHSYYYLCKKDWQKEYLDNASINKDIYPNAELGLLAIQSACLFNSDKNNFQETASVESNYFTSISKYLDDYEEENKKLKFKYLDTSGSTNNLIFHMSGMYDYIKDFKTISKKEKFKLENKLFKNLQFQQARISSKNNKNFLNKYIDDDLRQLIARRSKIKIKYNNLISRMFDERDMNKLLKIKASYEKEIDNIDNLISRNYQKYSSLNNTKTYNIEHIQQYLRKDEAMIYLINEEIQQAFVVTKDESFVYSNFKLTRSSTKGTLELSKENIVSEKNTKFNENINALIFNTFFKDIIKNLVDIKRLIIIADKYYSSYPFEMMIINNPEMDLKKLDNFKTKKPKYLIQDYQVNYLPNIELFIDLNNSEKKNIDKNSTFLGVGNPKLTRLKKDKNKSNNEIKFLRNGNIENTDVIIDNYEELPFTEKELNEMSKVFKTSKLLMKEKANENNIKKMDLRKFDIISFATHAELFDTFEGFNEPFLVLSPPGLSTVDNDGLLTTSEISQLNLNSELVILSACNTSSKKNEYAEGYSGLVSSFFQAGTKSVISTYWPVEDQAGYILMTKTVEKGINNKISISEALRQTKIEFIEGKYGDEYKKPFYWAPYVYVGL